jgi:copper chaperone CopZ
VRFLMLVRAAVLIVLCSAKVAKPAAPNSVSLSIKGMTWCNRRNDLSCSDAFLLRCSGACVNTIESHLQSLPGVVTAVVSLLLERTDVTYDPKLVKPEQLASEISDIGFEGTVKASSMSPSCRRSRLLRRLRRSALRPRCGLR